MDKSKHPPFHVAIGLMKPPGGMDDMGDDGPEEHNAMVSSAMDDFIKAVHDKDTEAACKWFGQLFDLQRGKPKDEEDEGMEDEDTDY